MLLSRMPDGSPEIFASVQGEGFSVGTPSVFVRAAECNLQCTWCFVPETPILMSDWTWKPLSSLEVGDEVVGIEQPNKRGAHVKLGKARVTRLATRFAETVLINGALRSTPDHKFWLTGKDRNGRSNVHAGWREVSRAVGLRVLFTTEPITHDPASYERGWLAGMADGDGCFWTLRVRRGYRRFRLALNDTKLLDRAAEYAERAGFALRWGIHNAVGFAPHGHKMKCLWLTADAKVRTFEDWLDQDQDHASWRAGYLGGILDAEGSHSCGALRISQDDVNAETRGRITMVLEELGIKHTVEPLGFYLHRTGGLGLRALSIARPAKQSLLDEAYGHHPHATRVIESVEPTNRVEEVVTVSTTLGSFIAGGYVVKNCDTAYTWDWKKYERTDQVLEWPAEEVEARVRTLAGAGIRNVVFTGGEPLLHQADLLSLATRLKPEFRLEVETNGAIEPSDALVEVIDQWNVSPKLESSGNKKTARLRVGPLTRFAALPNSTFKFVACSPADLDEIDSIVATYGLPRDRVLLMPEATDPSTLLEKSRWLVPLCQERGFRFGTRLHVALWGSDRGK